MRLWHPVILPTPPFKKETPFLRDIKKKRCQRQVAIEPIIGHLKSDYRSARNFLEGITPAAASMR